MKAVGRDPLPPTLVLGRRIGGSAADVFEAKRGESSVAVKLLATSVDVDAQRFARESRLAPTLAHPNIVRVLDVTVVGSRPAMVMELLDGETLESAGARVYRRSDAPRLACAVAIQVLDGL